MQRDNALGHNRRAVVWLLDVQPERLAHWIKNVRTLVLILISRRQHLQQCQNVLFTIFPLLPRNQMDRRDVLGRLFRDSGTRSDGVLFLEQKGNFCRRSGTALECRQFCGSVGCARLNPEGVCSVSATGEGADHVCRSLDFR